MFLLISASSGPSATSLEFQLESGQPYMVGRAAEAHCRMPLDDGLVSRYHATLEVRAEGLLVRDLQSRNGSFINGEPVTSALLRPGDRLRIGNTELQLVDLGAEPQPDLHDTLRVDPAFVAAAIAVTRPETPLLSCDGCRVVREQPFPEKWIGAGWLCNDCTLVRRETAPDRPETLAGYQIVRVAGRGGMGIVYEARHQGTEAHVALKVLQPGVPLSPLMVRRFLKEQRLAVSLFHPRIVRCFEVGQDADSGQLYLSTEWLPAGDAASIADNGGDLSAAVILGGDLFEALGYLHALGFVHRDVKPDNLLLAAPPPGEPGPTRGKVGDFGIIRDFREGASVTHDSDVCGTPLFMSPEQLSAEGRLGPSVDIYAGGATLYFLLTGKSMLMLPGDHNDADIATTLNAIMDPRRVPIAERRSGIPTVIAGWIDRAVSRDPAAREGMRAIEIADLLRRWLPLE